MTYVATSYLVQHDWNNAITRCGRSVHGTQLKKGNRNSYPLTHVPSLRYTLLIHYITLIECIPFTPLVVQFFLSNCFVNQATTS